MILEDSSGLRMPCSIRVKQRIPPLYTAIGSRLSLDRVCQYIPRRASLLCLLLQPPLLGELDPGYLFLFCYTPHSCNQDKPKKQKVDSFLHLSPCAIQRIMTSRFLWDTVCLKYIRDLLINSGIYPYTTQMCKWKKNKFTADFILKIKLNQCNEMR